MPENDPTTTSSAGAPPESSTPSTPAPGADVTGTDIANPVAKKYADEAAAERKARRELEAKLAQYEAAQQQAELAKLGDLERLQKQHTTLQEQHAALQAELQSTRLLREINRHGPSLNLIDPDAAQLMLERGGEIEYDSDGKPTNVAKLLEKLVAEKPYLIAAAQPGGASLASRPAPSSGGATNPSRAAGAASAPPKPDPKALYQQRRGLANPNLWKK